MNLSPISTDESAASAAPVSVPTTKKDVLSEILEWSKARPNWQRDALRRLVSSAVVSDPEIQELVELCKSAHGLAEPRNAIPLADEHLAVKGTQSAAVLLMSVTHHCGLNALAAEQTVAFGPNLTIVYGQNAAGKSGYARILKRACRSRGVENILGDVLSSDTPLKPKATIRYQEGTTQAPLDWTPDAVASEALARVSVFDAHCAPVYLRDKTDVAFRPYGLDIFDKLSSTCDAVRTRLEAEQQQLNKAVSNLPGVPEGTRVRTLIDGLTALTNVDEIRALATLAPDETRRLKDLREQQRDFQSSDPKKRSRELKLKAERLSLLVTHLDNLSSVLSQVRISELRRAADTVRIARESLLLLQNAVLTPDLLPGTGTDAWKLMWETASKFSTVAYPGEAFPVLTEGARCPFCQRTIAAEAAARIKHFSEYITSKAQASFSKAEAEFRDILFGIIKTAVERRDITLAADEIAADDPDLGQRIKDFLAAALLLQEKVKQGAENSASLPADGLATSPATDVRIAMKAFEDRANRLDREGTSFDPKLLVELRELDARAALAIGLPAVLGEVERKKRLAAYRQCIEDTSTVAVTRKSTELTKELVTDNLRTTFQDELSKLDFKHLALEIQSAGGAKGANFHRLVFTNAPGVSVAEVLSEGESRTLSLAAFLTELSTASSQSAIIFDDPVSSLDHIWRERIARRLIAEAKTRQVVVFTHDLLFLRLLLDESDRQGVPCENQYVRREGQAGICSPDLPWLAMPIKERIGKLRVLWQAAEKLHRTAGQESYESAAREIYGFLREAWERAITEVLLNDVVDRYRPSIETKKLRFLHDITPADCETVDAEMTQCSRWIRGHDQAAADGTPVPGPGELKARIDALDTWVKNIRTRR